jgi:hypothetical protein
MQSTYAYFWNSQLDEDGRDRGLYLGHQPNDELTLADIGVVDIPGAESTPDADLDALDTIYSMYNNPARRPQEYRGPSMSIGSVVILGEKAYSVTREGFQPTVLGECRIKTPDPRWIDG